MANGQASMPAALLGTWRIQKIVARAPGACWEDQRAAELIGTTLRYGPQSLTWKGGRVEVPEALARTVAAAQWKSETGLELRALGLAGGSVQEVDLQHEDADVTGVTTEVPGDTVVLAGPARGRPGRIVVSVCGVYLVAVRAAR